MRTLKETHRIATIGQVDSVELYITPLLERIHSISPTTRLRHSFDVDEGGAVLVCLEVGQRNYEADEIIKDRDLFGRIEVIMENYISANKGSDGCALCGAKPKQQCVSTCEVLEAELCLSSLRRVMADGE